MENILTLAKVMLASTPVRWQYLLDTYSLDLLERAPAVGEWSALECLQHLVDVDTVSTPVRLKAFLAGEDFPAFNPADHAPKKSPSPALGAEFTKLRQQNLLLLNQVQPENLNNEAWHPEYGIVTLSHFLHHLIAHDLMHTVQAEQAIMQPFIQGSGAWDVNYTAHIIDPLR